MTSSWRIKIVISLTFFGLLYYCFAIYQPGLYGPLLLDDLPQLTPILESLSEDINTHFKYFMYSNSGALGRPVSMATFIVNAAIAADDFYYWKLTNLVIHLLNACLLFWLVMILLQKLDQFSRYNQKYALLITALWLLHPLHVSTVLYTVQRMTELSTFFTLSGLLIYSIGRFRQTEHNSSGIIHISVALLIMLPLAFLSKENGVLLLPLIIITEIFIFHFQFSATLDGKITRAITYTNIIIILLGILFIVIIFNTYFMPGYQFRDFTLSERIYTEFRAMAYYLFTILVPMQQYMGFYHDDFPVSRSLLDPLSTLAALTLILVLLTLAWKTRRRAPLFGYGIFFFFTAHSLESTILPLELVFEHRNYLPSVGVMIAVLGIMDFLSSHSGKYLIAGMVLMALLSSLITNMRVATWSSATLFHFYTYLTHPESPRANIIRANSLAVAKQYDQANQLLSKFSGPGYTLNKIYIQCLERKSVGDKQLDLAGNELHQWLGIYELSGLMKIANLGLDMRCDFSDKHFLKLLESSLAQKFNRIQQKQNIMIYKAHYLHKEHNTAAAIQTAVDAYEINKLNPVPLAMAIEWLRESGQTGLARDYIKRIKILSNNHDGKFDSLINDLEKKISSQ